jgi:hypothetical protein
MDLREIGWGGMVWINLAQDRVQWRALVNTVMNLRVPSNVGRFLGNLSDWRLLKKDSVSSMQLVTCYFCYFNCLFLLSLAFRQTWEVS